MESNRLINATILVTDLSGFSKKASGLPPKEVFNYLDSYYNSVGEIVYKNSGRIIKYLGDGLLMLFEDGDGNSADNAVAAALSISKKHKDTNSSIHSGEIFYGEIGHPNLRNADIVGETVNVAYRQINLNKDFNIATPFVFITGDTLNKLENKHVHKFVGEFPVKSLNRNVKFYKIATD
jgi:adenylate cyclase